MWIFSWRPHLWSLWQGPLAQTAWHPPRQGLSLGVLPFFMDSISFSSLQVWHDGPFSFTDVYNLGSVFAISEKVIPGRLEGDQWGMKQFIFSWLHFWFHWELSFQKHWLVRVEQKLYLSMPCPCAGKLTPVFISSWILVCSYLPREELLN